MLLPGAVVVYRSSFPVEGKGGMVSWGVSWGGEMDKGIGFLMYEFPVLSV